MIKVVCLKLNKQLYGTKQASRAFYQLIKGYLINIGFIPTKSSPCIFKLTNSKIYLGLYVDDLILLYEKQLTTQASDVMHQLGLKLNLKSLGYPKSFLKIKIGRKHNNMTLSQEIAIKELVKGYELNEAKVLLYPLNLLKDIRVESPILEDVTKYRSIIGGLSYLSMCTRPDIFMAISTLAQYAHKPTIADFNAAKGVLRYLKGTENLGLNYKVADKGDSKLLRVEIYTDADFANATDRKSRSGVCVFVNGNLIDWSSTKQKSTSLSTCEAEYIAMSSGAQKAKWLTQLFKELNLEYAIPKLYIDNQAAKNIAVNDTSTRRTKHIDVRAHFIREMISDNLLTVDYVSTDNMLSDIFTKNLVGRKFIINRDKLIVAV